jgi:hypothetical protein
MEERRCLLDFGDLAAIDDFFDSDSSLKGLPDIEPV